MFKSIVSSDQPAARLDKFLAEQTGRARNQVQLDLAAGRVLMDGQPVTQAGTRLRPGQVIEYAIPTAPVAELRPEAIALDIRHEDDDLIVLDKPAGMVVHPAPGHASGTLANALLAHCGPRLEGVGGAGRWGIVHRLDAWTSGLMLAAKTQPAYERLVAMLSSRAVRRLYLGLALGQMDTDAGTIDRPMMRRRSARTLMGVVDPRRAARFGETGKAALTDWELLLQGDGAALLALSLQTGRTHQIRVHLQSIGRPILGDPEYGWTQARTLHALPAAVRPQISATWPRRQMLHASRLVLMHPLDAERKLDFASLPPDDMRQVLELFWPAEMLTTRITAWQSQPVALLDEVGPAEVDQGESED